ncbi:TrkH family potassium uptake protein [Desulfurivibrio dismutans]|uniref:TrkH family potassium uptake protein n=1 Tax=Desulfurivibrio dismutans TaxID=1398908 RepID=UPI0023DC955F|nr:potassium transporter TrkG [Desulfurivibrio alkaliphilus]MDF1615400.1 potassium transporter TrkG [Desulfurivibrio alkaliphilus]
MHTGGVLNILGKLLLLISLFLLTPIPVSAYYDDGLVEIFLLCAGIGVGVGAGLILLFRPIKELSLRDGFAVVTVCWLGMALLGSLPYLLAAQVPSFVDALFESMSGFTTTGSTILTDIEALAPSLLFWRATTQWLGGMGIIVLSLAILPLLGIGGMQLFQAEMTGPTKDRLTPRIQDTARILWSVYVFFTLVLIALLMFGGLSFYDATTHAFCTISTAGFSPYNDSVGHFNSTYVEVVIIIFMFIGGINFAMHHHALRGRLLTYWHSEEFRLYLGLTVGAMLLITFFNYHFNIYQNLATSLRYASFQTVSILTTSGFGTADFTLWPSSSQLILVGLMLVGGMAGSTAGSIKTVRFLLFFKYVRLQLRSLIHPQTVSIIKLGGHRVPREVMTAVLGFFALYFMIFLIATLVVTALGVDLVTGTTAVIATLNNIGPGLHLVGPAHGFADLPALAKVILTFCMLAGRLELYTVIVLLTPAFWRTARRPEVRFFARRQPTTAP